MFVVELCAVDEAWCFLLLLVCLRLILDSTISSTLLATITRNNQILGLDLFPCLPVDLFMTELIDLLGLTNLPPIFNTALTHEVINE